jgi:hypothetical protein
MFLPESRNVFRNWVLVLVAAQIRSAPFASARSTLANATGGSHCDGHSAERMAGADCPCCPDGTDVATCLIVCASIAGPVTSTASFAPGKAGNRIFPWALLPPASLASPPLDPPPIV